MGKGSTGGDPAHGVDKLVAALASAGVSEGDDGYWLRTAEYLEEGRRRLRSALSDTIAGRLEKSWAADVRERVRKMHREVLEETFDRYDDEPTSVMVYGIPTPYVGEALLDTCWDLVDAGYRPSSNRSNIAGEDIVREIIDDVSAVAEDRIRNAMLEDLLTDGWCEHEESRIMIECVARSLRYLGWIPPLETEGYASAAAEELVHMRLHMCVSAFCRYLGTETLTYASSSLEEAFGDLTRALVASGYRCSGSLPGEDPDEVVRRIQVDVRNYGGGILGVSMLTDQITTLDRAVTDEEAMVECIARTLLEGGWRPPPV